MSRTVALILALALATLVGVGFPASAINRTPNIGANNNNLLPSALLPVRPATAARARVAIEPAGLTITGEYR